MTNVASHYFKSILMQEHDQSNYAYPSIKPDQSRICFTYISIILLKAVSCTIYKNENVYHIISCQIILHPSVKLSIKLRLRMDPNENDSTVKQRRQSRFLSFNLDYLDTDNEIISGRFVQVRNKCIFQISVNKRMNYFYLYRYSIPLLLLFCIQIAVSFLINFSIWGACASYTMSAVILPQLSDPESGDVYMDKEQGSWFGRTINSSSMLHVI